ncbi:hypothetical protein L6164_013384 [Bauhinia variegata]|uniref:Uncharacterized protein n=1 Tax=Bauhinia variegata TaxID=167791 RepID=A0ACB9NHM3_BAUVA|nr:hypothetical protein L6164_013384 [Bauhinia variegata]
MNSEEELEILSYLLLEEMFLEMVGLCFAIFMAMSYSALWWYENHCLREQTIVREGLRGEVLERLIDRNDVTYIDMLCMDIRSFRLLCALLRNEGKLKEDGLVSIEEQVAMFLHILEHNSKNHHATGKGVVAPVDVVEQLEEENNNDEVEIDLTESPFINQSQSKRKHDFVKSQNRKKNRGANLLANSIYELGKSFGMWLNESSERLGRVADRLGVAKDVFDDSRSLMNELKKMDLTEQERFAAEDKIFSIPHRLHMFWGSNDIDRLAFVNSLI